MKVLVIGGGGREHALVWKLSQSPRVSKIVCAPGNAGIAELAKCVPVAGDDLPALLQLAREEDIDITVVGPEVPLVAGVVDAFENEGLKIFGPSQKAAALEGSKIFAKDLMKKYNIPTAKYEVFSDPEPAIQFIKEIGTPCVIKADGLAAGKGVIIAHDEKTALDAVHSIMVERVFGASGEKLIVEECLVGEEVSVLAFTDGKTVLPLLPAQDHKQVFDDDQGPNTGGMGAYCPAPVCPPELQEQVLREVLIPTVQAMEAEGCPYRGIIYAGLMISDGAPRVLEYNARFGDPEAQPLLMLLETDLLEIVEAVVEQKLHHVKIEWKPGASVCVVMSSGGYPGDFTKGYKISGLKDVPGGIQVFHAATGEKNGEIVSTGGRVLGVTSIEKDIAAAIDLAYAGVRRISFENVHYRLDIGKKAL